MILNGTCKLRDHLINRSYLTRFVSEKGKVGVRDDIFEEIFLQELKNQAEESKTGGIKLVFSVWEVVVQQQGLGQGDCGRG